MSTTFENGYSNEFDFPRWQGPPRLDYMIATLPRTGSTFLAHELWRTGQLGAPLEYLNFSGDSHYTDCADIDAQLAHWDDVRATRTSPNGIFGQKMFLHFLGELKRSNPILLTKIRPQRIIYLSRRDKLAQSISYARAHQTGVWTAGAQPRRHERYSSAAIERARTWIDRQEAAWERLFIELGIDPYRVDYETMSSGSQIVVSEIAAYLGVDLTGKRLANVPAPQRQSDRQSDAWRSRYLASNATAGS